MQPCGGCGGFAAGRLGPENTADPTSGQGLRVWGFPVIFEDVGAVQPRVLDQKMLPTLPQVRVWVFPATFEGVGGFQPRAHTRQPRAWLLACWRVGW